MAAPLSPPSRPLYVRLPDDVHQKLTLGVSRYAVLCGIPRATYSDVLSLLINNYLELAFVELEEEKKKKTNTRLNALRGSKAAQTSRRRKKKAAVEAKMQKNYEAATSKKEK